MSFPTPPPEGDDNPFAPPPADGSGAVPPPPPAPTPEAATPPSAYGTPPPPPPPPPVYGAPQYGAPAVPAGYGYQTPTQNGSGTAALILGILGLVCCGLFTGIPAIILGRKGMAAADAGLASNRGVAQAGYILGIIVTVLSIIGGVIWILLLATGKATGSTTISP